MKKTAKADAITLASLSERVLVLLSRQLADHELGDEPIPPQLGRLIVSLRAEERQQERMERSQTVAYTPEGVLAWARKLPPHDRQGLVREIQNIDSKRSGLA